MLPFDQWMAQGMMGQPDQGWDPMSAQSVQPMPQPQPLPPPPDPRGYGIEPLPAMKPGQPGDLNPYVQQQKMAAERAGRAQQIVEQEQQRIQMQAQPGMERGLAEREQAMQRNNEEYDRTLQALNVRAQQVQDQIREQSQQSVDPSRFFKNSGTWQKIAMGVALAVSGALNPRGPNIALGAIERAIERDIEVQKDQLNRRDKALAMEQASVDRQMQMAGATFENKEHRRAQAWQLVADRFKFESERTTDELAKRRAMQGSVLAEQKAADAAMESAKASEQMRVSRANAQTQAWAQVESERKRQEGQNVRELMGLGLAADKMAQEKLQKDRELGIKEQAQAVKTLKVGDEELGVFHMGNKIGVAKDKVTYRQAREYTYKTGTALEQIDDLINNRLTLLKRRPDLFGIGSPELKELRAEFSALAAYAKGNDMLDLGKRLEGMENDLLKGIVGEGVDTWFTKDPHNTLRGFRKQILIKSKHYYGSLDGFSNPFENMGDGGDTGDDFDQAQDYRANQRL